MIGNLQGWHLIIILVVILLLFGAAKLPALAKSIGQSARGFKGEMKAMKDDDGADAAAKGIAASSATESTVADGTASADAAPVRRTSDPAA